MDMQTIGMIAAGLGVVATVIYIVLGLMGINLLRQIRDQNQDS
jgi:hypothetical protein